jgi:predicted RND superfamily exporter protein
MRFSTFVIKYKIPIVAAALALAIVGAILSMGIKINPDILSYLPLTDPVAAVNAHVSETYGGSQLALIALEYPDAFSREAQDELARLTEAVSGVDGVRSVTSLANILDIQKTEDGFEIGDLTMAPEAADATTFKDYVLSKDLYRGRLVSEDGTTLALVCRLAEDAPKDEVAKGLKAAVAGSKLTGSVRYAGLPFQLLEISSIVRDDIVKLVPIAGALIALALALSFRSLRGVFVPLATVAVAIAVTIGTMRLCGIEFSVISNLIPVVILAAGNAYAIHVMGAFEERGAGHGAAPELSASAISSIILPVFLAALTTIVGFVSFIFGSYLTMIRDFGIFSALGILLSFLLSVSATPALLCILKARRVRFPRRDADRAAAVSGRASSGAGSAGAGPNRAAAAYAAFLGTRRARICVAALFAALAVFGALGIPRVRREVDILSYFNSNTEIHAAEVLMKKKFGGSATLQVVARGDVKDPAVLKAMKAMETEIDGLESVSRPNSIVELVEELNWAVSGAREIPATREEVAQLWFLLEGRPELGQLVAPDGEEALISAIYRDQDSGKVARIVEAVDAASARLGSDAVTFAQCGSAAVYHRIDVGILKSLIASIIIGVAAMLVCDIFLVGSLAGGLIGVTPVVFTLFALFGLMGWAEIPLDVASVLIGSISLGMGIDYSIHYIHRFTAERAHLGDPVRAAAAALGGSGKAIAINVATVSVGFLALLAGNLLPLRRFGVLIAYTMLVSGIASLTLLPALLLAFPSAFEARERRAAARASRAASVTAGGASQGTAHIAVEGRIETAEEVTK